LKNLDLLNPEIAQPRTFSSTVAFLPFLLGLLCIPLAFAAAPSIPFSSNFLAVLCAAQSVISFFFILIPRLFRWDWRSKYFGVPLFYVGSTALVGVVPWLGIVFYSALPVWARFVILATYTASIIWWCRRFVIYYRRVFTDHQLRRIIYQEDEDAIYYLQRGDQTLIEKKLRLAQFPPNSLFVSCMAIAFSTTPFAQNMTHLVGISYILIFLAIGGFPIVLMCFGLATRGYLIFYYYPWQLKRQTGKEVYVLMATQVQLKDEHV
jgi:hypothetical protein